MSRRRAAFAGVAAMVLMGARPVGHVGAPVPPTSDGATERARAADAQVAAEAARVQGQAAAVQAAQLATAQAQARRLAVERIGAAARLRSAELATGDVAARVAALSDRGRVAAARLAERERAFRPLLPLLERLSLYPAETLIAMPGPPEQALRGVLVLGAISRQLEGEAAALRAEQAQVRALGAQLEAALPGLAAAQAAQATQAASLDRQIEAAGAIASRAEDAASQAAQRAAGEAARADGLRSAIAHIDAERRAAETQARAAVEAASRLRRVPEVAEAKLRQEALARPAGPGLASGHAALTAPVAGRVVHGFGEISDAGSANGVSYAVPPAARVVSPCDGRTVFSGPFRSYGKLLIVDCGGGFHVVLAGLDRLDAPAGQPVQAGEPVGVMPQWDPRAGGRGAELYIELRKDGDAVDPTPFLRAKS